jgi:crotonobetaine/carnitine-CoA ligase
MKLKKTIRQLLENRAKQTPDYIFAISEEKEINFLILQKKVNRLANGLAEIGIAPGEHVAVMLNNHIDHAATYFALASIGAIWVPINVNLRGSSLEWILTSSDPRVLITESEYLERLEPIFETINVEKVIVRGSQVPEKYCKQEFSKILSESTKPPPGTPSLEDIRAIMFTSGTTGMPKGAMLTERMLVTCGIAAGMAADVKPGDVFLLWEPIYHSAGAQMCVLSLLEPVTLAIVPRFSASRFWSQVRKWRINKLHYLGGVLDILLKLPPQPNDHDHPIEIAFGAGCTAEKWTKVQERFGIKIREVYGLTEGSCFTTLNSSGKIGSIGKPYPYLDVKIVDDNGNQVPPGKVGEIIMRGKEEKLVVPGYLKNPKATAEALRDGWLHTGDLGRYDEDGDYFYVGRKKHSIRRRGENVSAWEVEHILNSHPKIVESAVIGVPAEIGEEEIKAFIKTVPGAVIDPLKLIKWIEPQMPYFQVPRYIDFVETFEKTPTERIRKETLSRDVQESWDLEKTGYKVKRV